MCEVTLEVCDRDLFFQKEGGGGQAGGDFLARETAVNQIVKDEMFLSSHLKRISPSPVAAQKSLSG